MKEDTKAMSAEDKMEVQAPEMAAEDKPKRTARKPAGRPKKATESTPKKSTRKQKAEPQKVTVNVRELEQEPQTVTVHHIEQTEPQEPKTVIWKRVEDEPETKQPKGKPFSIYIRDDVRQKIATYTELTGMKTSQLITEAVLAYMAEHKITAEQKRAYQDKHRMITDIMNELS